MEETVSMSSDVAPMKPPVILFDPEGHPEISKTPADYYRNIFSPGVTEEAETSTDSPEPKKAEGSKP